MSRRTRVRIFQSFVKHVLRDRHQKERRQWQPRLRERLSIEGTQTHCQFQISTEFKNKSRQFVLLFLPFFPVCPETDTGPLHNTHFDSCTRTSGSNSLRQSCCKKKCSQTVILYTYMIADSIRWSHSSRKTQQNLDYDKTSGLRTTQAPVKRVHSVLVPRKLYRIWNFSYSFWIYMSLTSTVSQSLMNKCGVERHRIFLTAVEVLDDTLLKYYL